VYQWFGISWPEAGGVLLSTAALYIAVIALTRLFGLRSFSKMSAGDFAMTIAVGSVLGGSISNPNPSVLVGMLALGALFTGQWLVASLRRHGGVSRVLDNEPLLLVWDGQLIEENMASAQVSRADIQAKLREANVFSLSEVAAVVFETTGDVSVLHGRTSSELDDFLLTGVRSRTTH